MLRALLGRFGRSRGGSVSIICAVAFPALIGFLALVAEFGHGLVTKTENQRIADLAAYAGALAYASTSSTATMTAEAQKVASLNGVAASSVTASLVTSPRTATNQAVYVKIRTINLLLLAPVVNFGTNLPIAASSYAELSATASPCVLALSSTGTGVTLSGGTTMSAPSCSVASNTSEAVPCGTSISAKSVVYNGAVPSQPCSGISGSVIKTASTDPLTSNAAVAAASTHVASVTSLTAPSAPSVTTGTDISFGYSQASTIAQATAAKCSASFAGSTWTLTCPSGSTYYFGNITLGGGITVNFNTGGSASTIYNFSGSISNTGTALNFGPGTYNIAKGITTGGGTQTTFGAGTFKIGAGTSGCSGAGIYSICNTSTLTFAGPSNFSLSAGLYNSGGSTLTLGSGTDNTINIGPSSDGNAAYVGGGATTTLAETDSNAFRLVGNFNQGGGACTSFGIADQHDIYGNFITAGGTMLGAGVYTASGYIAIGANGGGDVTCNGMTVGVSGTGVTLVTGGQSTISSSSCSGAAFCVGAGFNNMSLSGPTSGTYKGLVVLGPTSPSYTGGAMLVEGSSNTSLSGIFYFPNGALTLNGGASVGNQSGQCLSIIATQITLSGGTKASASNCLSNSTASTTPVLVQ